MEIVIAFLVAVIPGCFALGYAMGTRSMTKHLRLANDHNQRLTKHIKVLTDPADWWKMGDGTCGDGL